MSRLYANGNSEEEKERGHGMRDLNFIKSENLSHTWRLLPIGKVLIDSQYGTNTPVAEYGNTRIIGMKDLQNGKIILDNLSSVNLSEGERKRYLLKRGDILINRTNSYDLVGKVGIFESDDEVAFVSYLVRLVADKTKIYPEFLNYWLNGQIAQRVIKRIATKAIGQANINLTEFKKQCYVPLPMMAEQITIAEIISIWDQAIEKTERLITAKENQYLWLLSNLISNDKHRRVHIRDFSSEVSTRNNGTAIDLVLSVTNNRGFVLPSDQFERRVASSDLSNYKIVTRGQYAYNPSRINVGSIARLDGWDKGVLSPMYVVFELNEKKVNSDFFLHWLESHAAKERIRKSAQGSVRETVSFTDFGAISFPLPSINEQGKIATILNMARNEIDLIKRQLEACRKQKRGLMQKLLTGQWRVKIT